MVKNKILEVIKGGYKPMKKHSPILIVLLIFLMVALAGCGNEQAPEQPATQQNEMTVDEFEKSAELTEEPATTPQQEEVEVGAPAPQTTAAPSVSTTPPAQEQKKEVTVYVTKTGSKYHQAGCRYLSKSQIPIRLSDAKNSGYEPCSRCNPPQ